MASLRASSGSWEKILKSPQTHENLPYGGVSVGNVAIPRERAAIIPQPQGFVNSKNAQK
jgi:hypothetical protein